MFEWKGAKNGGTAPDKALRFITDFVTSRFVLVASAGRESTMLLDLLSEMRVAWFRYRPD